LSMAKWRYALLIATLIGLVAMAAAVSNDGTVQNSGANESVLQKSIMLPPPNTDGGIILNKALKERRSIRTLKNDSLDLESVSQLLWAAQGLTDDQGHRTAGSAFEAYPLEIYVLAGNITNLSAGVYHYKPQNHSLIQLSQGDVRTEFVNASVVPENAWIKTAPATFLITGNFEKMAKTGAENSTVYIEVGLASENFLLEVVSLNLGCTYIAGFVPPEAAKFLNLSNEDIPIALLPVGQKA
jgi:SagB-type dehydrogenase family enzyme